MTAIRIASVDVVGKKTKKAGKKGWYEKGQIRRKVKTEKLEQGNTADPD